MPRIEDLQRQIGITPLTEAQRAPKQILTIQGHLLPGVDFSAEYISAFVNELGTITEMNIFNGPHIKTPESYDPKTYARLGGRAPDDINVSWMWDDSGGDFYVFPNRDNWCVLYLHTCKSFDAQAALRLVYQKLHFREDMQFVEQTHNVSTDWQQFLQPDGRVITPEHQHLPELIRIVSGDPADTEKAIVSGQNLEKIVWKAISEEWGERLASVFTPEITEKLRAIHSAFEIGIDDRFMDDVLAGGKTSPDEYYFQSLFDRLARMEAEAASMPRGKPVMHIGTGWPGTAIGLYRQFGIPVSCVEKDPLVARKSAVALSKLGLLGTDKLQVVQADGRIIDPRHYSTIIISAMVPNEHKGVILRNLHDLALGDPGEPLVILRGPVDRARALFYQMPDTIIPGQLLTSTKPGNGDPLRSYVYQILPRAETSRGGDRYIMTTQNSIIAPVPLVV